MGEKRLNLLVILGSNRPGRIGERVAKWVLLALKEFPAFHVDFADLGQMDLGLSLSANHPRSGKYEGGVRELADKLEAVDVFMIITPEHNHGYPAILKHAIDSIYAEWIAKAGAIISYGGASAGLRAAEQIRQVMAELRTHITRNGIALSGAFQKIDESGTWIGNKNMAPAFKSVADELYWWGSALKTARLAAPYPA